jgi:hypothetical protein
VALNKAAKGMPDKSFTVEFWAKGRPLDAKGYSQVGWVGGRNFVARVCAVFAFVTRDVRLVSASELARCPRHSSHHESMTKPSLRTFTPSCSPTPPSAGMSHRGPISLMTQSGSSGEKSFRSACSSRRGSRRSCLSRRPLHPNGSRLPPTRIIMPSPTDHPYYFSAPTGIWRNSATS